MPNEGILAREDLAALRERGDLIGGNDLLNERGQPGGEREGRVFVYSFGPTGAWAARHSSAELGAERVDWGGSSGNADANQRQMDATRAINRTQDAFNDPRVQRTTDPVVRMRPGDPSGVIVTFNGPDGAYDVHYNRVAVAMGFDAGGPSGPRGEQPSSGQLLDNLDMGLDPNGSPTLQSTDGGVRVMGAAATSGPGLDRAQITELRRRQAAEISQISADSPTPDTAEFGGRTIDSANRSLALQGVSDTARAQLMTLSWPEFARLRGMSTSELDTIGNLPPADLRAFVDSLAPRGGDATAPRTAEATPETSATDTATTDATAPDRGGTASNLGDFRGDAREGAALTREAATTMVADNVRLIAPSGATYDAATATFVLANGQRVRVEVGAPRDGSVASFEPTADGFVVTVSSRARDEHVVRAVAHELAEISAADRADIVAGDHSERPDVLTAHLAGRYAEVRVLVDQLFQARLTPGQSDRVPDIQRQLDQLVAELGLNGPDAEARVRLLEQHDPALLRWVRQVAPGAVPAAAARTGATPARSDGQDPMLPPHAQPRETRARTPEPFVHDGQAYDVMGVDEQGQVLLRDPRAVHQDARVEGLVGRQVMYNGAPYRVVEIDIAKGPKDATVRLVAPTGEEVTVSGRATVGIRFPGNDGETRALGQVRHGIVRMESSVTPDVRPVPLQPGQRFEARLRGRELEGPYEIAVGEGGQLVASGVDRDGVQQRIPVSPADIAPRYEAVYSSDFDSNFDVDAFAVREDQLRGQATNVRQDPNGGPIQDPLLGTLPSDTTVTLTNGADHLRVFEQFIRENTQPESRTPTPDADAPRTGVMASIVRLFERFFRGRVQPDAHVTGDTDAAGQARRLTVMNISMSNQGEARRVLDALVEFRRMNPDAEMTLVVTKLGPSSFQSSPEFRQYLEVLAANHINVDTFTGEGDGPTRQVIHAKGVAIDDQVLFATGAVMDVKPVDKADFSVELPPAAAAAFRTYMEEAIHGNATPERRAELAAELAREGVVINDPVAGATYISRAQDALIRGASQQLTVSVSELTDPALTRAIIERAEAGVDVVVQTRELDAESARLLTEAAARLDNLKFEDSSWWEPRPHFNAIVADDGAAYVGTSYLWQTQRNMVHQGRSFENGVLLSGDSAASVREQIQALRARAFAEVPATASGATPADGAPAPTGPADLPATLADARGLRTDDGQIDGATRDAMTRDLREVQIDTTNRWVAARQVAETVAPTLGRSAADLDVEMMTGSGPNGHGPTVFSIKDRDGNFLAVLKLSPLKGDFYPQLSAFERMEGPDAATVRASQVLDVARVGDKGMTLMSAAQGDGLRKLMTEAAAGRPGAVEALRQAYAELGRSLAELHRMSPAPANPERVTRAQDRLRETYGQLADHMPELIEYGLDPDAAALLENVLARFAEDPGAPALGHGDAHPGNFFWNAEQGITMIDFGGMHATMDSEGRGIGFAEHDIQRMVFMAQQFSARDGVPPEVTAQATDEMLRAYREASGRDLSPATLAMFNADSLLSKLVKSMTRFHDDLGTAAGREALRADIAALNEVLRGAGGAPQALAAEGGR